MGSQATVIILTDQLDLISKDPDFAKNLVQAILKVNYKDPVELYAHTNNCSANVGTVVECHNCNRTVAILAGGGYATILNSYDDGLKYKALKAMANDAGYTLRKKVVKK